MDPYSLGAILLLSQGETRPGLSHAAHWGRVNGLTFYADGTVMFGLAKYQSMQALRETLGSEVTDGIPVGRKRWTWH